MVGSLRAPNRCQRRHRDHASASVGDRKEAALDGLTISEAARILEIPTATFKTRLWWALVQLKRMMNGL
jgi:hypothetical protein